MCVCRPPQQASKFWAADSSDEEEEQGGDFSASGSEDDKKATKVRSGLPCATVVRELALQASLLVLGAVCITVLTANEV